MSSFYSPAARRTSGIQRLRNQINADKNNILAFNGAISRIQRTLVGRATSYADSVWRANVPAYLNSDLAAIWVEMQNPTNYMRGLNRATEEARFRNFVSHNPGDLLLCDFTPRAWFDLVRVRGRESENPSGFRRRYTGGLLAEWKWRWESWRCHSHEHQLLDWAEGTTRVRGEEVREVSDDVHFTEFIERGINRLPVVAKPQVLTRAYFGAAGTITVGVAVTNSNPFGRIIGPVAGIFSAFNPGVAKTVCFSSAKAGYGAILGNANGGRRYSIDWNPGNQAWNLCQSDWDAVFVPVRRSVSEAVSGLWRGIGTPFLGAYVRGRLGCANGDFASRDRWRIGNGSGDLIPAGGNLNWNQMHNRMFH
jgi:hypothetical protein